MTTTFPIGKTALLIRFGDRIDADLARDIARLATTLSMPGVVELIPSYTTLLIEFDPSLVNQDEIIAQAEKIWLSRSNSAPGDRRTIEIPVVYGGAHGPDLGLVSRRSGLPPAETIRRHSEAEYVVGAVGFSPGFGYLIGLPPELATPRLKTPRLRVPVGSVAIGGAQTAVYPVETAGGWNLIGRTTMAMFDPGRDDPFLLRSGDLVRFRPVESGRFLRPIHTPVTRQRIGGIEVLKPGLLTSVQDLGRRGFGAFGLSPNGTADTTSLILGNRLVGNPDNAAGLEITLVGPTIRFRQGVKFAMTGEGPAARLNGRPIERNRTIAAYLGDELTFDPIDPASGARGYLCFAGGIDVPVVMGSRSTDLVAGIGGLAGRALRSGDVIPVGEAKGLVSTLALPPLPRDRKVLRITPGPQRHMFDDATWRRLTEREFTVTNDANRVGIRMQGPSLHPRDRSDIVSEGVVTGSIQVPGSGQPIVLLPGRATIGGYPKIATVIESDLDLLGQLRPGDAIRFRPA
jgi:KipI family sensor histidine kinase inhibitor